MTAVANAIAPPTPARMVLTAPEILRVADQFSQIVWDEVMRHPGADADEIDAEAWSLMSARLGRWAGVHISRLASVQPGGPVWQAAAWSVIFGLRNAERRPTWASVDSLLEKHLGIDAPREVSGADAQARRVITAPPAPEPRALPPGASDGDFEPAWLDRFRRSISRDSGGPFDRSLLLPLLKLSDADAHRAIDTMVRERQAHERAKAEKAKEAVEKARVRAERAAGGDALGMLCRKLRGGQTARAAVPIHPDDDPVIQRGRHNIAEVGQPVRQQEDR